LGEFATDQGSFDFGKVAKTATGQVTVALSNPGNVAVNNITAALSSATASYAIDMTTVPTTLAAADTKMVKVNFTPVNTASGGNTTLTFSGSWGGVPTPVTKQVTLTGTEASFTVDGVTTLDFGSFRFDSPPTQMFNVLDDGNATLGISAPFTPDPTTSALEYKIVLRKSSVATAPPVPFDKDQMITVEVTPQLNHRLGMVSGHIDVTSDVTGLTSRVVVTGTANAAQVKVTPDNGQVYFGAVDINGPPPTRTVTIENSGNELLDITSLTPVDTNAANPPNPAFAISSPGVPAHLQPHETLDVKVTYTPRKPTSLAADPMDASKHDFVSLNAELTGSLNATLSISIKGDAVFVEATGGAGCNTASASHGSGLTLGLAALGWLRRRRGRSLARLTVTAATGSLLRRRRRSFTAFPLTAATGSFMPRHGRSLVGLSVTAATGPFMPRRGRSLVGIPVTAATGPFMSRHRRSLVGIPVTAATGPFMSRHRRSLAGLSVTATTGPFAPRRGRSLAGIPVTAATGPFMPHRCRSLAGLVVTAATGSLLPRRRRLFAGALAAAAMTITIEPAARADDIGLSVFEPTPATTSTGFALQTPEVGASGSWGASAVASYASNLLLLHGGIEPSTPVARSTLIQLGAAYALLDRLEIGAHLPLYQQSGEGGQAASGMARGNLALHAKARLWSRDFGAGRLIAGLGVTGMLPTASKNQFTGSDQPEARFLALGAFSPSLLGSRLTLSLNAGPVFRKRSTFENIGLGSGVIWGAGASIRIVDQPWQLSATAELFGQSTPSAVNHQPADPTMKPPATTLTQVEGLAGITIKPDRRVAIGLALGRAMTSAIGTPDLRGVLSLSVVPGAAETATRHPPVQNLDSDTTSDQQPASTTTATDPRAPTTAMTTQTDPHAPTTTAQTDPRAPTKATTTQTDPRAPTRSTAAQTDPRMPTTTTQTDPRAPTTTTPTDPSSASPATATTGPSASKAAEEAFARGFALMKQGKYAEACAAFEASQRLDPGFGTQYNLAACYEKLGKLAAAWKLYRELAQRDDKLERRPKAVRLEATLAGRVPKLKLLLSKQPEGMQVLLDGVSISAQDAVEAPVDLGKHALVVAAPGYRTWRKVIDVPQEGKIVTVKIDLALAP
ncbi:MAG: PEGA domain-containing protein, partial [Deltaproteobacteria bacterium]